MRVEQKAYGPRQERSADRKARGVGESGSFCFFLSSWFELGYCAVGFVQ